MSALPVLPVLPATPEGLRRKELRHLVPRERLSELARDAAASSTEPELVGIGALVGWAALQPDAGDTAGDLRLLDEDVRYRLAVVRQEKANQRRAERRMVLAALAALGPSTIADIARHTELSSAAVSRTLRLAAADLQVGCCAGRWHLIGQ